MLYLKNPLLSVLFTLIYGSTTDRLMDIQTDKAEVVLLVLYAEPIVLSICMTQGRSSYLPHAVFK